MSYSNADGRAYKWLWQAALQAAIDAFKKRYKNKDHFIMSDAFMRTATDATTKAYKQEL